MHLKCMSRSLAFSSPFLCFFFLPLLLLLVPTFSLRCSLFLLVFFISSLTLTLLSVFSLLDTMFLNTILFLFLLYLTSWFVLFLCCVAFLFWLPSWFVSCILSLSFCLFLVTCFHCCNFCFPKLIYLFGFRCAIFSKIFGLVSTDQKPVGSSL